MKVFVAHNFYQQPGGEDAVFRAECDMLERAGHEVIRYEVRNDDIAGPVASARAALNAPWSQGRFDELVVRLRDEQPDVVHVHNFFPQITPAIFDAARAAGAATVLTLHNFRVTCAGAQLFRNGAPCELCVGGSPWQGALHRCYRGSLPGSLAVARMIAQHRNNGTWDHAVDRFIALTPFAKTKFIAAGLPENKLAVKPNFLPHRPAPTNTPREGFLFVGRLSEEKGLRELLTAWGSIDARLTVIGDGPQRAELEALAAPHVRFEGAQFGAVVAEAMASARALVVPSRWYEGFPVVIAEAYAAGLPVIASDIGSLSNLVDDGVTGRLVPVDHFSAWRDAVMQLARNDEVVTTMGAAARARFEDQYTEEKNLPQLEAIYREAIASAREAADAGSVR